MSWCSPIALAFCLFWIALTHAAQAQEGGEAALYAPAPPVGSAFVRVAKPGVDRIALQARVGKTFVFSLSPGAASAYFATAAGPVTVEINGHAWPPSTVAPGRFYTVVAQTNGLRWIEDPAPVSRAKAGIVFYNFTDDQTLDLVTVDGTVHLLDDVAPNGVASRAVNAVTATLAVEGAEGSLSTLPALDLHRGATYSIFAQTGPDGRLALTWLENATRVVP